MIFLGVQRIAPVEQFGSEHGFATTRGSDHHHAGWGVKFECFSTFHDDTHFQTDNSLLNRLILNNKMAYALQRPTRVLVTGGLTNLMPSYIIHNQTFYHLSNFVIVVHLIFLLESVQKIVHTSAFGSVDQVHQSVATTTLTEQ